MMLEILDRRVRHADEINTALGLPLLGIMPKPVARGMLRRVGVTKMQQRLMAPASVPSEGA
jgi:hypothetical protein